MPRYEINNLIPVVKDVGNGKQPPGTIYATQNLVPIKKLGSLTSRNGYTNGLGAPSGLVTLDKHLTFPITFPSSIDYHLYFFQAAAAAKHVTAKPFFHNSSTAATDNNGWVDINENVTIAVDAAFKTATTINGGPTNTYVLANATTTYGLSATTDYYRNWVLVLTSNLDAVTHTQVYLIKAYSVTTGTATFTLDNIIDNPSLTDSSPGVTFDKANLTEFGIYRYFHGDRRTASGTGQSGYFTPSYTSPAGYFTETAIRFSGGAGSTVGYKNIWYGYIDRTFFNSVTANKYRFQGSYCDQAEIFKPNSQNGEFSIQSGITQSNPFASEVIKNEVDRSLGSGIHWTSSGGNHSVAGMTIGQVTSMLITNEGAGDNGTNNIVLTNTYTNALTNGATYKIRIPYFRGGDDSLTNLYVEINGQTLVGSLSQRDTVSDPLVLSFTASGTTAPTIKIWMDSVNRLGIYDINVFLSSDELIPLRKGQTIKYYAVFVYDGFQRSDPTYLNSKFLTIAAPKVTVPLRLFFGSLNKRITAIESYCTLEDGDTTSNTTIRNEPLYFIHNIPICDNDTGWSFDSEGYFKYTDTITGADFQLLGDTWEQRTQRIENSSLTCSYDIAENCSGRIFLSQYYDYVDARFYTNAIRYTNFDKFGNMCPDVLSNVDDEFVTYINAGAGTDITTLFERKGELVVGKEASVLRIAVNQPKTFWSPIMITNSVGVLNDFVMQSLGNTLYWTDDSGVYRWDGGEVELYGDGIWSQFYRDNKTVNQISWIDRYDGSYNLSLNTAAGNYWKLFGNTPYPYYQNLVNNVTHVAVIKDGVVYFATSAGVSYKFSTDKTDNATSFATYIDTGVFTLAQNKVCYIKEIEIDLQILSGTTSGTMQFSLKVDGTTISTVDLATTTLTNARYRPPLKGGYTFQLFINTTGTPFKSNNTISYNRLGFDYDEVALHGDVSAL